jgi:hypothetical protein
MYNIETKATGRHITFGHSSFEFLLVVSTAAADSELRGVSLYITSADLFQVQKISFFSLLWYLLIVNILLNIAYLN